MCIVLFHVFGNNWTFDEMRPIFLVGLACELPCAVLACFFSDKDVVAEEDDADTDQSKSGKKYFGLSVSIPKPKEDNKPVDPEDLPF